MARWFALCALTVSMLVAAVPKGMAASTDPVIELPLEIRLVQDMDISRRSVDMTNWLTGEDIERAVLPEINRIWRQAGITWTIVRVEPATIGELEAKQDLRTQILQFEREPRQLSPSLVRSARAVARQLDVSGDRFHLLVVPYVGRTLQGFAMSGRPRVSFVGVWTDKPSHGSDPPRRVKLAEPEPLFIGSLARTASHELGHLLGLKHDTCSRRCLMGGTRSDGYLLTSQQISAARANATQFVARSGNPPNTSAPP